MRPLYSMTETELLDSYRKLMYIAVHSDNSYEAVTAFLKARNVHKLIARLPENEEGIVQAEAVDHTRAWLRDGSTRSLRKAREEEFTAKPTVPAVPPVVRYNAFEHRETPVKPPTQKQLTAQGYIVRTEFDGAVGEWE